jgi:hypothetical protein
MGVRIAAASLVLLLWASPSNAGTQCPDGSYIPGDQCVLMPNGTYASRGGPVGLAPNSALSLGRVTPSTGAAVTQQGATLCPNGQYVIGTCHLQPDGSYIGGN